MDLPDRGTVCWAQLLHLGSRYGVTCSIAVPRQTKIEAAISEEHARCLHRRLPPQGAISRLFGEQRSRGPPDWRRQQIGQQIGRRHEELDRGSTGLIPPEEVPIARAQGLHDIPAAEPGLARPNGVEDPIAELCRGIDPRAVAPEELTITGPEGIDLAEGT